MENRWDALRERSGVCRYQVIAIVTNWFINEYTGIQMVTVKLRKEMILEERRWEKKRRENNLFSKVITSRRKVLVNTLRIESE